MSQLRRNKYYSIIATIFLYSTLIVDLYRKWVGVGVEGVRNTVYIGVFTLLLIDMYRSKHLWDMFLLLSGVMLIYIFSMLGNPGYNFVYQSAIFLFISRLWPAFYIGRYTVDWKQLTRYVRKFIWVAAIYALSVMLIPEMSSGQQYATIASNLAFVSVISLCSSIKERKIIPIAFSILCLIPVLFYGTRLMFVGLLLSLLLLIPIIFKNRSGYLKVFGFFIIVISSIVFIALGDQLLISLADAFPNSRTLTYMLKGNMLDDSNRFSIYTRLWNEIIKAPFNMHGFIGDRIFITHGGAGGVDIFFAYSHNVYLELMMNFGLLIGGVLGLYFSIKMIKAIIISYRAGLMKDIVLLSLFGITFMSMLVSASYLHEYSIWLMFGLVFQIIKQNINFQEETS